MSLAAARRELADAQARNETYVGFYRIQRLVDDMWVTVR
jgi:hypothetical protein